MTILGLAKWLGLTRQVDANGAGGKIARPSVQSRPAGLADDQDWPIVTFGIPLKSAQTSNDWSKTQALLVSTLRSVFQQSDPRWRVLICGHEVPDIPEMADPRVEFIAAQNPPPPQPKPGQAGRARSDKSHKRLIIGTRAAEQGTEFYMDLDADDLIHRDLVATALASEHGCVITTGYICDAGTDLIAPLPGVLSVDYDRICGSMAVLRLEPDDFLPGEGGDVHDSHFFKAGNHGYLRGVREEMGRALSVVPFAAGIYVINSEENLSFVDNRRGDQRSHLISRVHELAIRDEKTLRQISDNFGWHADARQVAVE